MIEQTFFNQFPRPLPRDPNSTFRAWVDAHQDEFDSYDQDIGAVIASHRIMEAEGADLDEIGEHVGGLLGKRRGRGDEEYRQFLMSIVNSFAGRGTPRGMSFAIGSGVQAQPDDIEIIEHYGDLAYSVVVGQWISHRVSTLHELADLSDPSGVELRTPIIYAYDETGVGASANNVVAGTVISIPDGNIGINVTDVTVTISRAGAGAGRFDGMDEFGEGVGLGQPGPDSGQDSYGQTSYGEGHDIGVVNPEYVESNETLTVDEGESLSVSSPMDVEGEVANQGEVSSTEESGIQTMSDDETSSDGSDSDEDETAD